MQIILQVESSIPATQLGELYVAAAHCLEFEYVFDKVLNSHECAVTQKRVEMDSDFELFNLSKHFMAVEVTYYPEPTVYLKFVE